MRGSLKGCGMIIIVREKAANNEECSQNDIQIEGMDSDGFYKYLRIL